MPLLHVRREWLAAVTTHCHEILELSPRIESFDLVEVASRALDEMPDVHSAFEHMVQHGTLLDLSLRFSERAHHAFHRNHPNDRTSRRRCKFEVTAALEQWSTGANRTPKRSFLSWLKRYARSFRLAHPLTCVLAAEAYIQAHFRSRLTAGPLARRLTCSTSYLEKAFKQLKGKTMREYQTDLRIREAVRQLRHTEVKIEAVAADVGYRSKKDFYRIVRLRLGCTPGELRRQTSRLRRQHAA